MIPRADEIQVWLAFDRALDDPALLARLAAVLAPEELERRSKLYFEHDKHQFLVTRALQRCVLAKMAGDFAPRDLRFVSGPRGKPALAPQFEHLGLHFNVAHTRGLVAMAVARRPDVGVDVENTREREAPLHLANRYFTAAEVMALEALPQEQRAARFFALWTLKEAWLKATGEGLSAGLANASFELDSSHQFRGVELVRDRASEWRFWRFAPSGEHAMALASRGHEQSQVRVTLVDSGSSELFSAQ